jgi:hypothetical protein
MKKFDSQVQVLTTAMLKLSLLLALFVMVNSQSGGKTEFVVLQAIKAVLRDHFTRHEQKVDLYFYGPSSEDLAEKLLREKPLEVSLRLFRLDEPRSNAFQIDFPSILLFDSAEHYGKMWGKIKWHSDNGEFHNHLVYAPKTGKLEIISRLSELAIAFENQNFITVVNETAIDLVTSFSFSPNHCNTPRYKTINQFSTNTMKWQNETFFPDKYQNFYGCRLRAAHIMIKGNSYLFKLTDNIFNLLAQQLNFELISVPVSNFANAENYVTKCLEAISSEYYEMYDFSPVLFTDHLAFTVPGGEPYTLLELFLAGAFLIIQVINFMSIVVQKFVFGRDIRTPTLNMVSIFLNGAQHKVAGRNFARFMLMMFVLWTLIIRTCYQSELYKNLQGDLRKPRIKTVEELNEQNFTFLYLEGNEVNLAEISVDRQVNFSTS